MDGVILTNRSAVDRNGTDFYETPPEVTVALLDFMEERNMIAPGCLIWEPASGGGKMVRVMLGRGYGVIGTDLHPTVDGLPSIDFLSAEISCNWIITNPPFSQAEKFIRHALELRRPCAFLLKSQFWHAKSRLALFREHPPAYVLPLTWRPDFLYGKKSGSPTMECVWTVWNSGNIKTEYIPLERPKTTEEQAGNGAK
jgi:hypothetical protein